MSDAPKRPVAKNLRILTDEVLDGFSLDPDKMPLLQRVWQLRFQEQLPQAGGGIASVCMRLRKELQCERDGVEFDINDLM